MSVSIRLAQRAQLVLLALLLSACAGTGRSVTAVTPEQRAQERWDLLLAGDFVKAYEYLSPGMRSESTAEAYAAQMGVRPVKWTAAKVLGADCDSGDGEGLCRVTVKVDFTVPASIPGVKRLSSSSSLVERWIRIDGEWFHVSRGVALGR